MVVGLRLKPLYNFASRATTHRKYLSETCIVRKEPTGESDGPEDDEMQVCTMSG
jgi:hypothetical protein